MTQLLTDTETAQCKDVARELLERKDGLLPYEFVLARSLVNWSGRISKHQARILKTAYKRLNNGKETQKNR